MLTFISNLLNCWARLSFLCYIFLIISFMSNHLLRIVFLNMLTWSTNLMVLMYLMIKPYRILASLSLSPNIFCFGYMPKQLPTNENLRDAWCHLSSRCDLCQQDIYCSFHLFLSCMIVQDIWSWLSDLFIFNFTPSTIN